MKNLQDGIPKQTQRGDYCPAAHIKSNDFGLCMAKMLEQKYGCEIIKCIVNPELVGKKPCYSGDDGGFDAILKIPDNSLFYGLPISKKRPYLYLEMETKCLKTKFFNARDIWPRHFPTADFGWIKYRDPKDHTKYKEYIKNIAKRDDTDLIHCLGLYYIDENNNNINLPKYSWVINVRDLVKEKVEAKDNSRKEKEPFYVVNIRGSNVLLMNLDNGEIVKI